MDNNLNTGFYKDLDTNFEEALNMAAGEFTHSELMCLLKNGNIPQKQFAAMCLSDVYSQEESNILINNLTGCDGKIREAVALKLNELKSPLFSAYPEILADASIDINPNVCRLVIDTVATYISEENFRIKYSNKIIGFIDSAFAELDNFIFRDKKYVINKQLFKLYWSLESLKLFAKTIDNQLLIQLLNRAMQEKEYTVREKVAQIALDNDIEELIKILKNDENYYVRAVFV